MSGIASIALWLPYRGVERASVAALHGGRGAQGNRPVAGADEDGLTLAWDAATRLNHDLDIPLAVSLEDVTVSVRAQSVIGRAMGRHVIELGQGPRAGWDLLASDQVAILDVAWGVVSWARSDEPVATWHADAGAAIAWREDAPLQLVGNWQNEGPLPVWRNGAGGCQLDWSAPDQAALFSACDEAFSVLNIRPERDRIAVSCPLPGVWKQVQRRGWAHVVGSDFGQIGYARGADPAFTLARAMEGMQPGDRVALVVPGAGATVLLFELADTGQPVQILMPRWQAARAIPPGRWAAFRRRDGHIQSGVEMSSSLGWREASWQLERMGFRCAACGELSWPAQQNCIVCGQREGRREPVAATGTVFTGTIDHLHPSLDPPTSMIVADLDGGGRAYLQGTDDLAHDCPIGTPVEMALRRYHDGESGQTPHYFWKLRRRA
ncbi:MAG: hypothetical protein D6761_05985 [Candidatus Dadabacteria bacterium]|nr:MAG: hypothetical protein D6761_05985 [Candidatus Dadabacteria bacterium]